MKTYIYQLTHDNGKTSITIDETSRTKAVKRICALEGCPERALQFMREITL